MGKLAIAAAAAALAVAGVAFATGIDGGGDDRRLGASTTSTTTGRTTTTEDRDRRGHRAGKQKHNRRGRHGARQDRAREAGEDVRGPCDEAEHANDPRCTGGESDDGRGRSGGNSGPG